MRRINVGSDAEQAAAKKYKKERKPIPIDEMVELIPGMLIKHIGNEHEIYRVLFAQECRDAVAVCLDDCGHTVLVSAWDGEYEIEPDGHAKVRIAYGKTPDGVIGITEAYYYNEQDFKDKNPQANFWYVEALRGTVKIVENKKIEETI